MKNLSLTFYLAIAALFGNVGVGFASDLPLCEESAEIWNKCFGTSTYASGDEYVGEWSDNKKDGQGTYTSANGSKYVGEFKNDKRNGRGINIWSAPHQSAGQRYVGEFKDGKMKEKAP